MTEQARTNFDRRAAAWDNDPRKVARAEAMAAAIRAEVPIAAGMRMLEYGCGTGLLSFALAPFPGEALLTDVSDGMLAVLRDKIERFAAPNFRAAKLDLLADPLPAGRYDLVTMLMVLHHIPDTDAILRKLHAILAPGGRLCVGDLDLEGGAFHGPGFDGHNGFDRDALAAKARAAGFTRATFTTAHHDAKQVGGATRLFPLFLMVAEKA
jgi:ubiquinone/menaquinone biosynthesis C-methylase UbiE